VIIAAPSRKASRKTVMVIMITPNLR